MKDAEVAEMCKWRHCRALATAAVVIAACAAPADERGENANADSYAHATQQVAVAPTADALLWLEKQANEAYIKGNAEFFEPLLSDELVMQEGGLRLSKNDVVKMISGIECEVEADWSLTEPQITKIDDGAYVLSYESNLEGNCTADALLSGHNSKSGNWIEIVPLWEV